MANGENVPFYLMSWPDWPSFGESPSPVGLPARKILCPPPPALLSEEGKKILLAETSARGTELHLRC